MGSESDTENARIDAMKVAWVVSLVIAVPLLVFLVLRLHKRGFVLDAQQRQERHEMQRLERAQWTAECQAGKEEGQAETQPAVLSMTPEWKPPPR